MTDATPEFQRFQRQFLASLRDPRHHPAPQGIPALRMGVYRSLLYNKIEDSLLTCFPITHKLLGKRRWTRLVRAFISDHRCRSPYYRQIPDEFIDYLQTNELAADYPPVLPELAHYEWIELVLSIAEGETEFTDLDPNGDLLDAVPVLAPVMRLLTYRYPVHRITAGRRDRKWSRDEMGAEPTIILGFRTQEDAIRFIEVNAATAQLIGHLQAAEFTGRAALRKIAEALNHPAPEALVSFGAEILLGLKRQGAILGTRNRA